MRRRITIQLNSHKLTNLLYIYFPNNPITQNKMNNVSNRKRLHQDTFAEEEELGSLYQKSYDLYGNKDEDQLHLIEGYTDYFVDKKYITLMHQRLNHKISSFIGKLLTFHNECKRRSQGDTEPNEIEKVQTCVIDPLRAVRKKIIQYDTIVLHALHKKALGAALHITEEQDTLNIIYTMCRTSRIELTFTLHYVDNEIEYSLMFDKERLEFLLYGT